MLNITTEDIAFAERTLLEEGQAFDDQRRSFITDFTTADLQAVPGSGKTTTLLGKLVAMSRHLPLPKNQGILVLSHTNTAVDEIKERIADHCPTLFKHPHFIGTIQSFINTFLCIPGFVKHYGKKPTHIDADMYANYHDRFISRRSKGSGYLLNQGRAIDRLFYKARLSHENTLLYPDGSPYTKPAPTSSTHQSILALKQSIRSKGILSFEEAYVFASQYLHEHPIIKRILRKRFPYVFVDEMQDMEQDQYQLLDEIFDCDECMLQRIGDKNQEIFTQRPKETWVDKAKILSLNGSHRLTPQTATCANQFLTYGGNAYTINGLRTAGRAPIMFVHSCPCDEVLQNVSTHLNQLHNQGDLVLCDDTIVKAVAGVKYHPTETALTSYHSGYHANIVAAHPPRRTIYDYLCECRPHDNTYKSRSSLVNQLLVRILRIVDVKNAKGWFYTVRSIGYAIKQHGKESYDLYKRVVFETTSYLIRQDFNLAKGCLTTYIPTFLALFDRTPQNRDLRQFLAPPAPVVPGVSAPQPATVTSNIVNYHGFDIHVGTVHSAKGQTHDITIFLESYYYSYECEKVADQLLGKTLTPKQAKKARTLSSLKQIYVGLSRPKHLACYVIQKDRFDTYLAQEIGSTIWDVVYI